MSDGWYEIVIEATEDALEAFLTEAAAGSPETPETVVRGDELDLEPESLGERIRELLGARCHHLLFAPAESARRLARAAAERPDIEVDSVFAVDGGHFTFSTRVFSESVRDGIRAALSLSAPPPGVALEGFEESEERHPEAKGVELYSPDHDYVYRASGTLRGRPPALIELYRRACELDFVEQGPLHLDLREVPVDELR